MIDVIIPAYIPSETYIILLNRALKSLEAQTYKDFKVKVVLNGIYDHPDKILSRIDYSGKIDFTWDSSKMSGAQCRNIGIKLSNQKYIAQLDADDQYIDSKLEKQINFLEKNENIDAVGSLYYILSGEQKHPAPFPYVEHIFEHPGQIKNAIEYLNVMCHGSIMFKKDIFQKYNLFYNEEEKPGDIWKNYGKPMWEDWDLWIRMNRAGINFYNLPERLYIWTQGTTLTG